MFTSCFRNVHRLFTGCWHRPYLVGRVTPCALLRKRFADGGAPGVTRPTRGNASSLSQYQEWTL